MAANLSLETAAGFRAPMLATATDKLPAGRWVAEEKYDGHRLVVKVTRDGDETTCIAWSRLGNRRTLPRHLVEQLAELGVGTYDGELVVSGGISSDVADLSNSRDLRYVVFDYLNDETDLDMTCHAQGERRYRLERRFDATRSLDYVTLAPSRPVFTWKDVEEHADFVWSNGGEGLILKDTGAIYRCGKRTKFFLKIKEVKSACLKIVGFAPSEGEIVNRGDHAITVLVGEDGKHTVVKTLNDALLAKLNAAALKAATEVHCWKVVRLPGGTKIAVQTHHPWVGKKLWIEYQLRTADGSYRHPRWDHLDGE